MFGLKIVVCIKLVPAVTNVKIDLETGTLIRDGLESEVNPFDRYAMEEAIRLKEKYGGQVIVISMGPPQAEFALREALALGCDEAILITDKKFAGADTLATSYTLSAAIRKIETFDIILCGHKTTDGDTGQVGPGLAEWLNIPHISYVSKILQVIDGTIIVERSMDNYYEEIETSQPCLITVTKEINVPRLPSFKRKIQARKMAIRIWSSEDLDGEGLFGLENSPTRVIRVFHPSPRSSGEMIHGNPRKQVEQLISKLKERKIL